MLQHIIVFFDSIRISHEWVTFFLGAMPISEVRGAIPYGLFAAKFSLIKTLILSIAGNLFPIVPTLVLLEPISNFLMRFKLFKRFFTWLFERTKAKADVIEKYEALGLMIFVAIPLPMTGAWTGCIAASLFRIRFRYAALAVAAGVLIAALIVSAVCLMGQGVLYNVFVSYH